MIRRKLDDPLGSPKILSQIYAHKRSYNLTWTKPSGTPSVSVLYYALRYRKVGMLKWKNVDEIVTEETQTVYSYAFEALQWDVTYEVEIYAGSNRGVGSPATVLIRGPERK